VASVFTPGKLCRLEVPLSRFIYVATVADCEDENTQAVVLNFIDGAVVACSYPPFAGAPDELNRFGRSWIRCQEFYRGVNPPSNLGVTRAKLPLRGWRDVNQVGHTRPRSALTWSHGIGSTFVRRISSRESSAARISVMSSASSIRRSR